MGSGSVRNAVWGDCRCSDASLSSEVLVRRGPGGGGLDPVTPCPCFLLGGPQTPGRREKAKKERSGERRRDGRNCTDSDQTTSSLNTGLGGGQLPATAVASVTLLVSRVQRMHRCLPLSPQRVWEGRGGATSCE